MELRSIHAELRAIPDNVDETRTVEFVISNEKRDRHGTVLKLDGWKLDNYKRNPVVGWSHSLHGSMFGEPDPDSVIGKGEVFKEGNNLIGRVTFEPAEINPLAEKIFQKVKFGSLRTASVGFTPTGEPVYGKGDEARGGKNETQYFPGQELLEWSIVNIPSNPTASKREYADELDSFLESVSKALDGKLSQDELRKMTIDGIIKLMNGESVDADNKEAEVSQEIDYKRQQQLNRLSVDLAFHQTFEKEIEIEDAKKRQELEAKKREARRNLHKFYLDNNEPLKEE